MYVLMSASMVFCLAAELYWMIGRRLVLYGICIKKRQVRLLRRAASVCAAVLYFV